MSLKIVVTDSKEQPCADQKCGVCLECRVRTNQHADYCDCGGCCSRECCKSVDDWTAFSDSGLCPECTIAKRHGAI